MASGSKPVSFPNILGYLEGAIQLIPRCIQLIGESFLLLIVAWGKGYCVLSAKGKDSYKEGTLSVPYVTR